MQKNFRTRFSARSDNRKAAPRTKIQKWPRRPKWLGLSIIAFVLAVAGAMADAQQPTKIPRIGYLSTQDPARESARSEGVRLALRELGYIEGQNVAFEYRYAERKQDRSP